MPAMRANKCIIDRFYSLTKVLRGVQKKHLVGTAALKERFPDFDTSIVEFVPYTNVTTWGRGSATRTRMYWDTDVHDMSQRLSALENAIQMGQPSAHKKLQEFKTAQTDRVHEILKHADISDQLPGLWRSKTEILGFLLIVSRDLNELGSNLSAIRRSLMREIHSARIHRTHMEAQQADEAWKRKARELYADYCKKFTHRRVIYMPPVDQVLASRFSLYTESSAKTELRRLIANWTTAREQKLSGLIPMPEYLNFVTARQALRLAKLATAVFICTRCTVDPSSRSDILLLDHDQSILHANGCDLSFSSRGALAVESLVKSLGLYVRRTVPRNLDHIDARFICLRCKPVKGLNYRACPSLTWRQCVAHFVDPTLEVSHATPNWRRLNEGEEAAVKARQGPDSALSSRIWTCNHCDQFDFKTHCSAVTHVKAKHAIHHPAEGPDFFCDPRKSRPGPRKGLIVVDPSSGHGNGDGEAYICL
ncbi:hypothetical protein A0H81_05075 [Grifola frondosa]|uniref:Uncharacterized protein n=1 Tax=Grifola frondosa TaxID=5627 RepID=A0A1C7MCP6_GRIFR|nr:hypothetical protein A0H81_05075 [Grifola frondosa]